MESMLCAMLCLLSPPDFSSRVLVVENLISPVSIEISAAYRKTRKTKNRCLVECPDSAKASASETISFADYKAKIEAPIRESLRSKPWIDFIVLTKGIPIRITGADLGVNNDRPSVDSYLAGMELKNRKGATSIIVSEAGFTGKCWANPYWNSVERFSHEKFGIYLVTRLDGYTLNDVLSLISSGQSSERRKPSGSILLDMARAPGDLSKVPLPPALKLDGSPQPMADMGYSEWD